ncbi:hypothetical protein K438DRAFT_1996981 [Mycena galopus ATCC 62051]|nr:hypothetical protein K438DRAFT_1996981 [Mycena galopus ATCC 62051]
MARNQENTRSMGYRFREAQAQAAELGLGTRADRRPAGARANGSGRAVADYELRNLNDDINKQLHKKWHWPHRIAAGMSRFWMMIEKGGAGYKEGDGNLLVRHVLPEESALSSLCALAASTRQLSVNDTSRTYHAAQILRPAKELPGVRELEEDSAALEFHKTFQSRAPEYYGDGDQVEGASNLLRGLDRQHRSTCVALPDGAEQGLSQILSKRNIIRIDDCRRYSFCFASASALGGLLGSLLAPCVLAHTHRRGFSWTAHGASCGAPLVPVGG